VKVIKVYKGGQYPPQTQALQGAIAQAGFVDVQPVVSQVDGGGQSMQHSIIYGIPFMRTYGSVNALIMDPVKGDIGYITVCDRDVSAFWKSAVGQGQTGGLGGNTNTTTSTSSAGPGTSGPGGILPASRRRFSPSDSVYIGGVLNQTPKQYVTFTSTGMQLADMNGNKMTLDKSGASNSSTGAGFGSGAATGASATNTNTGINGLWTNDNYGNSTYLTNGSLTLTSTQSGTIMSMLNTATNGVINHTASGNGGNINRTAQNGISDTATTIAHNGVTNYAGDFNLNSSSPLVSASNITAPEFFGIYNPPSDARTKTDSELLVGALALALQLKVKTYTQHHCQMRDGEIIPFQDPVEKRSANLPAFRSFGVHAQECRAVLPDIVRGDESREILSVQETKLGILALAALQEAWREIEQLRQRVVVLEAGV
jgi:hypothetical protein